MRAHGYTGDLENVDEKVTFLEEKFKAAGIPKPRNIRDWYTKHTRPNSNRRVYQRGCGITEEDKHKGQLQSE